MRRRIPLTALLGAMVLFWAPHPASAFDAGKYRFAVPGEIRTVRGADLDGDGRGDLVLLMASTDEDDDHIILLRAAETPARGSFFSRDAATRLELAGPLAKAGAMSIGRFGPKGETRLRFFGPDGITDVTGEGQIMPRGERLSVPTLFRRGPARPLVIWDGVADLDGDGVDEVWFPVAAGNSRLRLMGKDAAADRTLDFTPNNRAATSDTSLLRRVSYVPRLTPTDLDGDGKRELVALEDDALVVFVPHGPVAATPLKPARTIPLPFLAPDPKLAPEALRAPRVQLEDVDGDGVTDLLVTLISGRRDQLGSLRTTFFHYPGPFADAQGKLVKPQARIDTEAVALHPTFVDFDGDGDRDYVGDSIRAGMPQLMAQLAGRDPTLTYVGFRFDAKTKTFESSPAFTLERPYAVSETMGNTFGRAGWFGVDFDGDGFGDLLDLGNLKGVGILGGTPKQGGGAGDPVSFARVLMPTVGVKTGLAAGAVITDLNNDGRSDAVLWGADALYIVVPRGGR